MPLKLSSVSIATFRQSISNYTSNQGLKHKISEPHGICIWWFNVKNFPLFHFSSSSSTASSFKKVKKFSVNYEFLRKQTHKHTFYITLCACLHTQLNILKIPQKFVSSPFDVWICDDKSTLNKSNNNNKCAVIKNTYKENIVKKQVLTLKKYI